MDNIPQPQTKNLIESLLFNTLSPEELDFCIWALGIVYGWKPEKIRHFKVATLGYWIVKAKKRMTVGNLIGIHYFLKERQKSKTLWEKITSKS
jgi:hypothetical protein